MDYPLQTVLLNCNNNKIRNYYKRFCMELWYEEFCWLTPAIELNKQHMRIIWRGGVFGLDKYKLMRTTEGKTKKITTEDRKKKTKKQLWIFSGFAIWLLQAVVIRNDFDSCPNTCPVDDHLSSFLLTPFTWLSHPRPIPTGLFLALTCLHGFIFLHFKCQVQPCFASWLVEFNCLFGTSFVLHYVPVSSEQSCTDKSNQMFIQIMVSHIRLI